MRKSGRYTGKMIMAFLIGMASVLCFTLTEVHATDRLGSNITMNENSYNRNLLTFSNYSSSEKTQTTTQLIYLDAAARVRCDQGELRLSASVRVGANGSRTNTRELTVTCYNSSGKAIQSWTHKSESYKVKHHWNTLSVNDKTIPKDTAYIRYYVYNHIGTKGALETENCNLSIKDVVRPSVTFISATTDDGNQLSENHAAGTKITYTMQFSEYVTLNTIPQFTFSPVSDQAVHYSFDNVSGKGVVQAVYTIPSNGEVISDHYRISVLGTSSFTFKDGASNSVTKSMSEDDISNLNSLVGKNGRIWMDNRPPELVSVTSEGFSKDSILKAGDQMVFHLTFHENIKVNGSPSITLSNGATAVYVPDDTTTATADFISHVSEGMDVDAVGISSFNLRGIVDEAGQSAEDSTRLNEAIGKWIGYMDDFGVRIDTTAPYVSSWSDQAVIYDENRTVELKLEDDGCGVSYVQYGFHKDASVLPAEWMDAKEVKDVFVTGVPEEEGQWYLSVIGTDRTGNTSEPYTIENPFDFDLNAPEIMISSTKFEGDNISADVTVTDKDETYPNVTYTWKDAETGKESLTGKLEENGPVPFPIVSGKYTLTVRAEDSHGHFATQETEILVDQDAPEVSLTCDTYGYAKKHVIQLISDDQHTAVEKKEYRWIQQADEDVPWMTLTDTDLIETPENENGNWTLEVRVSDAAMNQATASTVCQIDNTAPEVSFTPDGNAEMPGDIAFDVHVVIEDDNTVTSFLQVEYAISDTPEVSEEMLAVKDPTSLIIPVSIEEGDQYVHVRAVDGCGNIVTAVSKPFRKDIEAPKGTIRHDGNGYSNNTSVVIRNEVQDDFIRAERMEMQIREEEGEWSDWRPYAYTYLLQFEAVEGKHHIEAKFRDVAGNVSEVMQAEIIYDITAPVISLSYSTTERTADPVTVTATSNEGTWVTEQEHVFEDNGSHTFICVDEAGNRSEMQAEVNCIDHQAPSFTLSSLQADQKAHQSAVFTMECQSDDFAQYLYRWNETMEWISTTDNSFTLENMDGIYTVEVCSEDDLGNRSRPQSLKVKLDCTAPIMHMTYSPSTRTGMYVKARWTFEDESAVTIIEPEVKDQSFLFQDNGKQLFRFVDEAGNEGEFMAEVTWIDHSITSTKVIFKDLEDHEIDGSVTVNHDLKVIIEPTGGQTIQAVRFNEKDVSENSDEIEVIDAQNYTYHVKTWGILEYDLYDEASDTLETQQTEVRIDKVAPTCTKDDVSLSTKEWTNQDVTVRIAAKDDHSSNITYLKKIIHEDEEIYEVDPDGDQHVFTENGEYMFYFRDEAGNIGSYHVEVTNIDKNAIVPFVTYTVNGVVQDMNTYWTNQPVTAKLSFRDSLSPMEEDYSYVFNTNGSHTFHYRNKAGTEGSITVSVDHIDLVAPTGILTADYDTWTNQNVTVTLHAYDQQSGADDLVYVFEENGEHVFELYDRAGNRSQYAYTCRWIDKTAPKISIQYTPEHTGKTPFHVFALAFANETVEWEDGISTYEFKENGTFVFRATDRAGNTTEQKAAVDWITTELPEVEVVYSTMDPTSTSVSAQLKAVGDEQIVILNNNGAAYHVFEENGTFTYQYTDGKGEQIGTIEAKVDWIDRKAAEISITTDRDTLSNQPLKVMFEADEDVVWPEMIEVTDAQHASYVLEKNEPISFTVQDTTGNQTKVTFTTDLIDVKAPSITLPETTTAIPLDEEIDLLEGVIVEDENRDPDGLTVAHQIDVHTPGIYEITYHAKDVAGNETTTTRQVTVYDPKQPHQIINGMLVTDHRVDMKQSGNTFVTTGFNENMVIQICKGKHPKGDFKLVTEDYSKEILDGSYRFETPGYYTMLIRDQERQTALLEIYAGKEEGR